MFSGTQTLALSYKDLNGGLFKKGMRNLKESEMFRANKILEKNKKKHEGDEELKEEKLEQLKTVFSEAVKDIIVSVQSGYVDFDSEYPTKQYIKKTANKLVYEVKIRINNK